MQNNKGGFIYAILLVIIALILLKYFLKFDVIQYVQSPAFGSIAEKSGEIARKVYDAVSEAIGR